MARDGSVSSVKVVRRGRALGDSAGVRGLDALHAQAGSLGRTLVLVASPIVRRILELTAIDRTVVVYETLFDANQAAAGAASLQFGPPPDGLT